MFPLPHKHVRKGSPEDLAHCHAVFLEPGGVTVSEEVGSKKEAQEGQEGQVRSLAVRMVQKSCGHCGDSLFNRDIRVKCFNVESEEKRRGRKSLRA